MLEPMTKLHVIGHRKSLDPILSTLHQLGAVHLIDVATDSSAPVPPLSLDEQHQQEVENLRFLRARVQGLLALAPEMPEATDPGPVDLDRVRAELTSVAPEIERAAERADRLTEERNTLPRHIDVLRKLLPLVPELTELESYETAAVVLDARHAEVLAELNVELEGLLGGNFGIISDRLDADTVGAVVVFPRRSHAEVDLLFGREQVSRVRLPREYEHMPIGQGLAQMEKRLTTLPEEIEEARTRISDIIRPHTEWAAAARQITERLEQLEVVRKLGATPHTFVLSGWVPERRFDEIAAALTESVGPNLVVERTDPGPGEVPPVLLRNPAPARPFQTLVGLLALPRASSLDPTILMAAFLPLFFGMMLGDVAYGAVVLAIAWVAARRLRDRSPAATDIARVMILAGIWSVVWGVIYGEFLGDLGHRVWGWEPLWFNREEALEPLLIFALAVGGAHILLGMLLGLWQAGRDHNRHLLTERLGTFTSLIGLFLLVGVIAGRLPEGTMTPAIAAVVVGLVVVMVMGGPMGILMGPLELMGVVGNVLSYLRIAAIGLASVYLARVANELGAVGPVWMGVLVAGLFHTLNLALGAFSPTIQALRLHYVEFFGRFFEEGGRAYEPFGGARRARGQTAPVDRTRERS
jgi:V/A-type H+-transporting ATPase subunit I